MFLVCVFVWAFVTIAGTQAFSPGYSFVRRSCLNLAASAVANDATPTLESCTITLTKAAETKEEESEVVLQALLDLEKIARDTAKTSPEYSNNLLNNLNGSWRLVFTTGTKSTQEKYGKINYFPIKAVQSFDTSSMAIENGIYAGDFALVKFAGDFEFDLKKRKLEFDFTSLTLLQFLNISLGRGEAAKLGAKSGLGSESNVANAARDKRAFFNWISADSNIATARGGGGGLALWKRIE